MRLRSITAIWLLLCVLCYSPVIAASKQTDAERVKKIKSAITKVGTGFDSRVVVTLREKTKMRGYVSEIRDDYFVVVVDTTVVGTQVLYSEVEKIKAKDYRKQWEKQEAIEKAVTIGLVVFLIVGMAAGFNEY